MKKDLRKLFKLNPVAAAIALAVTAPFAAQVVYAGSGFGTGVDLSNKPIAVPTYYANSPVGPVPALIAGAQTINPVTGLPVMANTGKALRKFVDTLPGIPGITPPIVQSTVQQRGRTVTTVFGTNNLGQTIPLAVPEKWVDLNGVKTSDDYYEIAAVEFSEKMHSDLPKATHLRGYVQLSTATNPGKRIALTYPDGTPILDAAGVQVYAYDNPHHLGPFIQATKGTAVRVKFTNYLPAGTGGDLFIPVDTTITGAGTAADGTAYTQNRAEIHLVGGQSPWISAGTPHQWIAPAADSTTNKKGVSAQNVPDMTDPGNGSTTLYFPNDLSARFMFMQDRTSGLTRLNSYAGLEAGYMVTDPVEQTLVNGGTIGSTTVVAGTVPADQIPLIIEDKTFVPGNIAQQDAKWDITHWGQPGDLWFPHVYETNQSDPAGVLTPLMASGANPVGRWDFGPLFWPIFPATDALPTGAYGDASFVPEAFMDTPLVNGTAYPTLTVDPKAYRLRILNASNDRFLNLSWFQADSTVKAPLLDLNGNPIVDATGVPQVALNTEVKMVPAVGDAAGNPPGWDATNGVQLPVPQYAMLKSNITGEPSGPMRAWPTDNRIGGAPDPASSGPDFIVIGNDGGLLPNPVDIPAQPVTYEMNRRSITVGNIYGAGLLLAPAERSDAIVDFSQYAGKTLILYNDAPAPVPFNDVRDDYFTGDPDFTGSGGTYSTKPGYGPNTRTIMQIKVNAAPAGVTPPAYDPTPLVTALPAAYGATQPNPIVPAVAYNAAFGTNDTDIYAHVATGSAAQPNLDFSTSVNGVVNLTGLTLITSGGQVGGAGNLIPGSGTGYDPLNPPTVVFNNTVNGVSCLAANGTSASATAAVNASTRQVTDITNFSAGGPYTCAPAITFTNPPGTSGVGAQAAVNSTNMSSIPVLTKAEQELFDNRGRYNSTGGVELPLTNGINQTTVPLNYIDSPTEIIGDGEVQIWKLVDNGLWTNSVHFDMVDVQLLNRVGWDGTLKPPASNEVGWRDTLRLNPLEDVVVAMRAKRASVPFGLPQSKRLMDPSKAENGAGSGLGFTTATGVVPLPATSNLMSNYDNEFAWNSAVLGHSENDFTRPVVFTPMVVVPAAPTNLTDPLGNGTLTWTDPTPAATSLANPQNEIGFKIVQASTDAVTSVVTYTPFLINGVQATVPANTTSWTTPAANIGNTVFAVVAYNAAGDSAPSTPFADAMPVAPTSFTGMATAYNSVTLNWSGNTANNSIQIWRDGVLLTTLPGTATNYVDNTVTAVMTYAYTITVTNSIGSKSAGPVSVTTPMIPVAAPTLISALPNGAGTSVALRWTDNANNETAYWVDVTTNGVTTRTTIARSANQGTQINGTLTSNIITVPGSVYTFTITAVNVTGAATSTSIPVIATVDLSAPAAPADPTGLTATLASATRVTLTWLDNASTENSYLVTITNTTTNTVTTATVSRNAAASAASGGTVTYNATVVAGNSYTFSVVAQSTKYGLTTSSVNAAGPVTVDVSVPLPPTNVAASAGAAAGQIVVTWADASSNESGFTVQRSLLNTAGTIWGAWGNAGTVAANVATFTDTGRITGRQYRYQVRANGVVGNSVYVGPSNQVTAP